MRETVYWATFRYEDWRLFFFATEAGLCYTSSPKESLEDAQQWVHKKIKGVHFIESFEKLQIYIEAFEQYLNKRTETIDVAFDLYGTPFQIDVWHALLQIPYGETVSYAEIAEKIGRPKALQAVGTAIGKNPIIIGVPCHRVIRKDGGLGGFSAGLDMKRKLHQIECIKVDEK